ncbi:hypothetical protein ABEB36_004005 [Hypothenemus hampei]|uniref:Uncharacterized protein n=1 Tax=Hypothenemus hampei TaxID=57062 RepID=A0ABD1F285_HYPHA
MKNFVVFTALLAVAFAKPGGWGYGGLGYVGSVGYAAPVAVAAPLATASLAGPVSTGAILAGPTSTGAIIDGPRTTGAVLTGPTSTGAVLTSVAAPIAVAGPKYITAPVAAVAAPVAAVAAPYGLGLGVVTNGGGTIGVSGKGAVISGPPTAPVLVSGPSGKVSADGLWGPTYEGLPLYSKW